MRSTVFIAKLASSPCTFLISGTFAAKMVVFLAVFRLYRIHLGYLSTYFKDFLLLVEDDLGSVWGCCFLVKSRLLNTFDVF